MSRYIEVMRVLAQNKPDVIIEIGTWNGLRAMAMASQALLEDKPITYIGFDLFSSATADDDSRELNVKAHCSREAVHERLTAFGANNPHFSFELYEGDTRNTLAFTLANKDFSSQTVFVFLDGGHSVETIRSDWTAVKAIKAKNLIIVLDDFYRPDPAGRCPDVEKFGCNFLTKDHDFFYVESTDPVKDGGFVGFLVWPVDAYKSKGKLRVKPRNCVDDDVIAANVAANEPRISRWIQECTPHDDEVVFVSGGASLEHHLETLRLLSAAGTKISCVKHAHDRLIAAGIIPWSCVLLDPRGHVKDFIQDPHPDVRYFTASMVHHTTLDQLIDRGAYVIGYSALVGAAREKQLHGKPGTHIIGGTSAAMRSLSIFYTLGFRKFSLFGYDCCFWQKPDPWTEKHVEVEVFGRRFFSTYELIAEQQDFEFVMRHQQLYRLTVFGDGLIPHVWRNLRVARGLPEFGGIEHTVYGGNRALPAPRRSEHP